MGPEMKKIPKTFSKAIDAKNQHLFSKTIKQTQNIHLTTLN